MIIRPYTREDSIPEITALLHRAYGPLAAQGLRFSAMTQDDAETLSRIEEGYCLVAEAEGKVVGTVTIYAWTQDNPCPYYRRPGLFYFGQFAVDPSFQGQGLGRRLVDAVEDYAKSQRGIELALDTAVDASQLIALYGKWGFEIVDPWDTSAPHYVSVIMSKPIDGMRVCGMVPRGQD